MRKYLLILLLMVFSVAAVAKAGGKSVSVMTYNLENLFDTKHDKGKSDYTWLPLAVKQTSTEVQNYCNNMSNPYYKKNCLELDWSEKVMNQKIKNLSKVISAYNYGHGADIVVFQEIENMNVLKLLVKRGLKKMGYKYFTLIEGPDSRGIDIGMISKFPVRKQKYHKIDLSPYSSRSTRGILEVEFEVGKSTVTVFGNHWPSQGNRDETRLLASEVLKKAALASKSELVIATGDFNTLHDDAPHGLNTNILPHFEDVEVKGRVEAKVTAMGTHWYRGEWSSLDKIFVLKRNLMRKGVTVNYKTFEILYHSFMLKELEWTDRDSGVVFFSKGIPARFDGKTGTGYSDHLPVAIEFDL